MYIEEGNNKTQSLILNLVGIHWLLFNLSEHYETLTGFKVLEEQNSFSLCTYINDEDITQYNA